MTQPIERYRRMKGDLDLAISRLKDFDEAVAEIADDPFVQAPAKAILDAAGNVEKARIEIQRALALLVDTGDAIGAHANDGRESIGLIVDDSVKND